MTITIEQLIDGVVKYIDTELAPKATGMNKFILYFVAPSLETVITSKYKEIQATGIMNNLIDSRGNIELEALYKQAGEAINKSGKIYVKGINYFVDRDDVDKLYAILKGD